MPIATQRMGSAGSRSAPSSPSSSAPPSTPQTQGRQAPKSAPTPGQGLQSSSNTQSPGYGTGDHLPGTFGNPGTGGTDGDGLTPQTTFPRSAFGGHGKSAGALLLAAKKGIPLVKGIPTPVVSFSKPVITQGIKLAPLVDDDGDMYLIIVDEEIVDWAAYSGYARNTQNHTKTVSSWRNLVVANRAAYGWPLDLAGVDDLSITEVPFHIPNGPTGGDARSTFDGRMMAQVDPVSRIGFFTRATAVDENMGGLWSNIWHTFTEIFSDVITFAADLLTLNFGGAIQALENAISHAQWETADAAALAAAIKAALAAVPQTSSGDILTGEVKNYDTAPTSGTGGPQAPTGAGPTAPPRGRRSSAPFPWGLVAGIAAVIVIGVSLFSHKES